MTQAQCRFCKKIIIENWEKFLEESNEKYIQCPYCKEQFPNPKFTHGGIE